MARQAPFTEYEAVLLLDAYLRTVSGDASRRDTVKDCSDALRRMAINNGIVCLSWNDDNKTGNKTVCRNGFHVQE